MSSRNKILEEIHPLDIIREVQKRPALYAKDSPERAITHFKIKIWTEIAKQLFPDWDLLSDLDQDKRLKGLMKRWRNLRDTWRRQAEIEKRNREGQKIKKKMYVYYKHMSFLRPHVMDDDSEQGEESSPTTEPPIPKKRKHKLTETLTDPKRNSREQSILPSSTVYFDDIDEDKTFLMSLIPSFKRMNEDEKLTVKMEILKAIKCVKKRSKLDSLAFNTEEENDTDEIKKELSAENESESDPERLSSGEDQQESD